jgi:hypothetical protein
LQYLTHSVTTKSFAAVGSLNAGQVDGASRTSQMLFQPELQSSSRLAGTIGRCGDPCQLVASSFI